MSRPMTMASAVLAAGLALPATLLAFAPSAGPGTKSVQGGIEIKQRVVRPELTVDLQKSRNFKGGEAIEVQIDVRSGTPRLLSGGTFDGTFVKKSRNSKAFIDEARSLVADHPELFGVSPDSLVLEPAATLMDKDVQFIKFRVNRDGLRVEDATLDFRFKQGKLVQIANQTYAEAPSDARPSIFNVSAAVRETFPGGTAKFVKRLYRVEETKAGYILVRVALYRVSLPDDVLEAQVVEATGKIFEVRPTRLYIEASGTASAEAHKRYWQDPLSMMALGNASLEATGGNVSTALDGTFTASDSASPRVNGFKGKYINVATKSGTLVTKGATLENGAWNLAVLKTGTAVAYEDTNIAQAMAFVHGNKILELAKRYITTNAWMNGTLTINTNLTQTCNAYWDGSTINLFSAGGGCANTGNMADVTYHEWGHGLDANTGGIDDGAYSEGFADAISMALTRSNLVGPGFKTDGSPVRDMEPDKIYPQDQGEVHAEGLIIGGTFWDLFKGLRAVYGEDTSADMMGNYLFKTLLTASKYTDVYNAILVVDDNDADLSNKTPNFCVINEAFAAHGLAAVDDGCKLAIINDVIFDDSAGNGNGVIEPGETIRMSMSVTNPGNAPISGLNGAVTIVSTDGVQVVDGNMLWDDVAAGAAATSRTSATIQIATDVVCGLNFTAEIKLTADTRMVLATRRLAVGKLVGAPVNFLGQNLPLAIEDLKTVYSPTDVAGADWAGGTTVNAAYLKLDIRHSYVGDVVVSLVTPAGAEKNIYTGTGSSDDVHIAKDVTDLVKGTAGEGQWKLAVKDKAAQDTGTLDAFELTLTPAKYQCQ